MNHELYTMNQLRYRIMPVAAPWVAAGYAFYGEPATFKWAVFFNSLYPVLRAGGRVTARCPGYRRYKVLVKLYQQQKNTTDKACKYIPQKLHLITIPPSWAKSLSIFFSMRA